MNREKLTKDYLKTRKIWIWILRIS